MRKEWEDIKSKFFSYHNLQAGIWPLFLFCAAFGVYEPLRLGPYWLRSPIMMFSISVLIPFIAIGFISPYSFVGERKRGTLEPLLATPVSDQAILFGKIGIAVLYGWGVSLVNMLLGLGLINLFLANGKFLLYPLGIVVPTVLLSLFFSILVATIGTNSSFYAITILEAQRNLVMTLFIPMMLPAFFLGPFMPEEWKGIIVQITTQLGATNLLLILMVLLFMVDGIFMVIALTRFHRKLLMLE
jgi:ABC-2 type transport system permease protein